MKRLSKILLGVVILLVFVTLSVFLFSPHRSLESFVVSQQSFLQEAVGGVNGDSFYEERCVDVSQYYAQGFVNDHVDNHSCQIVVKSSGWATTMSVANSRDCWGNQVTPHCVNLFGAGWSYVSGDCGYTFTCGIPSRVFEGGFERVINTCSYDQNDLLVAETFSGSRTITKDSLRYPIKAFCRAHPSIVTDDASRTSSTSTNIPQTLIDGGSVSVAQGQSLTVFYVIQNNYGLPTVCDSSNDLALNVGVNVTVCKSTLGFTHICSGGVFDDLTGVCVVQGLPVCNDSSQRYDILLNKCVFNPPLAGDCSIYGVGYHWDTTFNVCTALKTDSWSCPDGYTFREPTSANDCSGDWVLCPQCPTGQICDAGICRAECSIGQVCSRPSNVVSGCNSSVVNGECDGVPVCGSSESWDGIGCTISATKRESCTDGSAPIINPLTGNKECVGGAPKDYHQCDVGMTFNNGACVPSVQVFDPNSQTIIQFQYFQKDCKADSDCTSVSNNLVCNKASGYCQTPVYYKSITDYTPIYIAVAIVIVGGLIIYSVNKKGKKRGRR